MKPGTEAILDFLRMRGRRGATSRDVWFGGGGSRLAARVRELRVDGYRIETRLETHDGARFARYVLQDPEREPAIRHRADCDADLRHWGCVCENPIPELEMRALWGDR